MNEEIWLPIKGSEDYQVSSMGRIMHLDGRIRKPYKDKDGYSTVLVHSHHKEKRKLLKVHRCVCIAFLEKPDGKDHVNHRNGIKDDNRLENLEWCSMKENQRHRYDVLGQRGPYLGKTGAKHSTSKQITAISIKTGAILCFDAASDAIRDGIAKSSSHVSNSIRRNSCHNGYIWTLA